MTRKKRQQLYYQKHKEKMCHYAREWAKNNKDKRHIARKKRYLKLKELGLLKTRPYIVGGKIYPTKKSYNSDIKKQVFSHYGIKCFCCGENNLSFLNIDHINDNGREHGTGKKNGKYKGVALYRFLIKNNYPTGIQTACFNCNMGRRINGGICPHKT